LLSSESIVVASPPAKVLVEAYGRVYESTGLHECGGLSLVELVIRRVEKPGRVKLEALGREVSEGPSTINPGEVKKAITPNPAESLLQYLTLAYIHDKLVSIVESSPMSEYRDAYLWLLATQIPVAMKNCSRHESPKSLLDALCEACGSDCERAWILGNITGHALQVDTATGRVKWSSLTRETLIETPIVYANISGYPGLWQLYNETLETHLAHPVGGKYLVYYNSVENTVFCDWERLVGAESSTPTQAPKESRESH
jgi:hypothetical protein